MKSLFAGTPASNKNAARKENGLVKNLTQSYFLVPAVKIFPRCVALLNLSLALLVLNWFLTRTMLMLKKMRAVIGNTPVSSSLENSYENSAQLGLWHVSKEVCKEVCTSLFDQSDSSMFLRHTEASRVPGSPVQVCRDC